MEANGDESRGLGSGVFVSVSGLPFDVASSIVLSTCACAVVSGVLEIAEGKPPAVTELSRTLVSPTTAVAVNGGGATRKSLVDSSGAEDVTEVVPGGEVGEAMEADCSAVVDWGAAGLRRKMPPSPNATGGAGAAFRPRAFSAGPTVTMIRLPSALVL